jgi:hypothetical protein
LSFFRKDKKYPEHPVDPVGYNKNFLDRIHRIIWIIIFLFSRRKQERPIPLNGKNGLIANNVV